LLIAAGKGLLLLELNQGLSLLAIALEVTMSNKVFKKITVVGCSSESYEKAIEFGLSKAGESLRGLAWFEVKELRGGLASDGNIEWQASLEVAFKLD